MNFQKISILAKRGFLNPTLCVSSAASFSQFDTSLSCANTFFGSFCNHGDGDGDDGDGGDDGNDGDGGDHVDNVHVMVMVVITCTMSLVMMSITMRVMLAMMAMVVMMVIMAMMMKRAMVMTCMMKQAAEWTRGLPIARVTKKTRKPVFHQRNYHEYHDHAMTIILILIDHHGDCHGDLFDVNKGHCGPAGTNVDKYIVVELTQRKIGVVLKAESRRVNHKKAERGVICTNDYPQEQN